MLLKVIVAFFVATLVSGASHANAQEQPAGDTQNSASPGAVFKIGNGVSPPRVIYQGDPEFSEQARQEHFQGTCVLLLVVGEDGRPRDIRVTKPIGKGLDEKAIEAVREWRFDPARKDGKPVAVQIAVEVDFHLYGNNDWKLAELVRKAAAGDAQAQLELSGFYFEGRDIGKDDNLGLMYLEKAARHGLPKAQFLMGEHFAHGNLPDYPKAYLWYTLAERSGYKHSDKKLKELTARMTTEQAQAGRALVDNWPNVSTK
jgi:TonB family protein